MALSSEILIALTKADPINDQLKPFLATFTSTYPSAKATDSPAAYEDLLLRQSTFKGKPLRT